MRQVIEDLLVSGDRIYRKDGTDTQIDLVEHIGPVRNRKDPKKIAQKLAFVRCAICEREWAADLYRIRSNGRGGRCTCQNMYNPSNL